MGNLNRGTNDRTPTNSNGGVTGGNQARTTGSIAGGMQMGMNDVTFADLPSSTLSEISKLEQTLKDQTNRDIILLAYEKQSDTTVPRH